MKNKNLGQIYWSEAKKIIPGGTMLFSKNPDLYLPKMWPAYFSKAKGVELWDLNGKKYFDLATMGVGTNILGYANSEINNEVIKIIKRSNISTLNSIEEIKLTKLLLKMNSWADMARYTKSGGEANLVALRAAKSASKNYKVAFCGYHGWHDWYLSANLQNKRNLDSHLMPNMKPIGISKNLKNSTQVFNFNNIKEFEKIVKKNNLAAVIMEVSRGEKTSKNFLLKIRKITKKKNICLIFDECTSGFREQYGGLYKSYNVIPDIVVYGKALGNGYPICAVLGKKKFMKFLSKSFTSSTFWTDRIGYVAAIKTLQLMKKIKSWQILKKKGKEIKKIWKRLSEKHGLSIKIMGLDALPGFKFNYSDHNKLKTFLTQEFLKKGFLASTTIYLSVYHSNKIINQYEKILDKIFLQISNVKKKRISIRRFMNTPESLKGFRSSNEKI